MDLLWTIANFRWMETTSLNAWISKILYRFFINSGILKISMLKLRNHTNNCCVADCLGNYSHYVFSLMDINDSGRITFQVNKQCLLILTVQFLVSGGWTHSALLRYTFVCNMFSVKWLIQQSLRNNGCCVHNWCSLNQHINTAISVDKKGQIVLPTSNIYIRFNWESL